MALLSIIIRCYFNEANIPVTTAELISNESKFKTGTEFEYILVDDGSKDGTFQELLHFQAKFPDKVNIIKLSGNFGSHNAILAGLHYANGDCITFLAADLQDPPELIPQMMEYWHKGLKLVIANRFDREESWSQKFISNTFHKWMKKYALPNVPNGGFDLALFDKQLKEDILKINEKNTHIFYLLTWLRYDYASIPYTRKKRDIGKSRWTLQKKIKLLIDSFVAFSFLPIRLISAIGIIIGLLASFYAVFILFARLSGWIVHPGWSSLMIVLLSVSAFQMLAMGIIGEYVWRSLDASRNRPAFVVDKVIKKSTSNKS